jgi:hypothetical protein
VLEVGWGRVVLLVYSKQLWAIPAIRSAGDQTKQV